MTSIRKVAANTTVAAKSAASKPTKGATAHQLTDAQVLKVLGDTKLAGQTNVFKVHLPEVPKNLAKALPEAAKAIISMQAGEDAPYESLNINDMRKVDDGDLIVMLQMRGEDNDQRYPADESYALLKYLRAVSGPNAQIYAGRWDDISSEYIGTMFAVQKPGTKELTFAQVVTLLP
jgi:hypothetical protein